MKISIIVAKSLNSVIGKNNKMPWHLPADLKYFKRKTSGHTIIMGRKTHESIGRPLPNRSNIIISRDKNYPLPDCCKLKHSLPEALELAQQNNEREVFIIGGGQIYAEALKLADKLYITEIQDSFSGDAFFPEIDPEIWRETSRFDFHKDNNNQYDYAFVTYERICD